MAVMDLATPQRSPESNMPATPLCLSFSPVSLGLHNKVSDPSSLNNRNLFSHGSGSLKSETKESAGPCFL